MILVDDLDVSSLFDVAGGHFARALLFQGQTLGTFAMHAKRDLLEVQDDVGDILPHALDGRKLVQNGINLHRRDRRALQRGQQNAAQRIAQGHAEAALERLSNDLGLAHRIKARLDFRLHRADQFLPVLFNHGHHPFRRAARQPEGCAPDQSRQSAPRTLKEFRRGGASADGSHYAESRSRRGSS